MSVTAKSVMPLAKSLRPWAEPLPVKSTRRPLLADTSDTHWLTALAAQDDPVPEICSWLGPARAGSVPAPKPITAVPATARSRRVVLRDGIGGRVFPCWAEGGGGRRAPARLALPGDAVASGPTGRHEKDEHEGQQHCGRAVTALLEPRLTAADGREDEQRQRVHLVVHRVGVPEDSRPGHDEQRRRLAGHPGDTEDDRGDQVRSRGRPDNGPHDSPTRGTERQPGLTQAARHHAQ